MLMTAKENAQKQLKQDEKSMEKEGYLAWDTMVVKKKVRGNDKMLYDTKMRFIYPPI